MRIVVEPESRKMLVLSCTSVAANLPMICLARSLHMERSEIGDDRRRTIAVDTLRRPSKVTPLDKIGYVPAYGIHGHI
jgi:hypothetical protein